ncbi:MAG: tyrosine--tRNA ligase [Bacteroidetes bacterium]|nr:tyrosine--tRNA ligase [Bacteroidota bacterium]
MSFQPRFNLVEELRWRGLLHDLTPGVEELLQREQVSGYIGFDPTADSLHIGNLVPIMLLVHLQRAGHKPIALVGGATGMVGDPSGKSEERKLLQEETINHNLNAQRKQLERFLEFSGANAASVVNNYDWFREFSFLGFIREVGKHITISYMMGKDSVRNRLENTGMSFTEFSYQLVQGYDFYHLYQHHGCKLQMGGSDQWGNITTGTELIRRMAGGEAYAITAPLITKSDGSKFGKSEGGNVWLDPVRTSPYKFYQFWLNQSDEDAARYIRIYTLLEKEHIERLEAEHKVAPHLRLLQKELAAQVTVMVHGQHELEQAMKATDILFGNSSRDALATINPELLLQVMEGVPMFTVSKEKLDAGINILELSAVETQVFPSKGEARKMIQAGGFSLNKDKIADDQASINSSYLLHGKFLLAQRGKKNYYLIVAE